MTPLRMWSGLEVVWNGVGIRSGLDEGKTHSVQLLF